MSDTFNGYTVLLLLCSLLTGLAFAWLLYGKTTFLTKKMRYVLAVARVVLVTLIGVLLFAPLIRSLSYQAEKPVVIIAQDNSLSIGYIKPAGFNQKRYEQDLQALSDQLSEQYEVKVYHFSDSIKSGFDFSNKGKLSNAAQLIARLNDEYLNRNVGAVILASDGIFNRGGSPLYELNKLKAPVYTIALGDTIPRKDLLVTNVNYNSLVYFDNEFTIEVQIQAYEAKGAESYLSVSTGGKKVYEERVSVNSSGFAKTIPVKLKASKAGLQKYTVQLRPVSNEISEQNNVQHLFIDVIDARQKVLIAAAAPHPDISALKQAISLNKSFEVKLALAEELAELKLQDYSLVILYQLPSAVFDATAFLSKLSAVNVSTWYIAGAQSNLTALNKVQDQITFSGGSNGVQETFGVVDPSFTSFDLDPEMARKIEAFDPLSAPVAGVVVNGNSSVVLNQRIGKVNTKEPQLFFTQSNGRKMGFLLGEGLWRWKLSEAGESQSEPIAFNGLISKVVQYLSAKNDKRKFKVYASKQTFDENEPVILNAVLYNDSYVPVNTPDVNVVLKNERGNTYKFLFSRTDAAYQLDAGTLPAGNYSYTATTLLGKKTETAHGMFYINQMIAEYQQTLANHHLLYTMSAQTAGKMYQPQDLLKLVSEVKMNKEIKTLSYEDRKYEELINFKWLFALIMVLLTMEWFLRKRNGEI